MKSEITTYPLDGIEYDAEDAAGYTATRTSGVYSSDDDFVVTAAGGYDVTVSAGQAWIHPARFVGYSVIKKNADTLTMPIADGRLPRIDRIVLRYDAAARKSSLMILQGTPASKPAAPELSRTAAIYDLCFAEITRPAGSTAVTTGDISDTRLDEALCGVMRDGVSGIPTDELIASARSRLDALAESYTGGYIASREITLPVSGWVSSTSGYAYQCDAAFVESNADLVPVASIALDSLSTAAVAKMADSCETFKGFVRFYAKAKPAKTINLMVFLLGSSATTGGSGITDEEKQALLKLLKVLSENCGSDATTPYNELATMWNGELLPLISPYTAQLGKATLNKLVLGRS